MKELIVGFANDDAGATSIEYGLIALIVAVGMIATVSTFPTALNAIFSEAKSKMN